MTPNNSVRRSAFQNMHDSFKLILAWRKSNSINFLITKQTVSNLDFGTDFQAPSTRIRIFLNPQLFLSGYGYRPHAYGEFANKSGNFLIRSPEWKFLNPITFRIRVDGRIRIFSDTMTSQNWRRCLPRKFKYGR